MPRSLRTQSDLLLNAWAASLQQEFQVIASNNGLFMQNAQQPLIRPVSTSLESLAESVADILRQIGFGQVEPEEETLTRGGGGRRRIPDPPSAGSTSTSTGSGPSGGSGGSVSASGGSVSVTPPSGPVEFSTIASVGGGSAGSLSTGSEWTASNLPSEFTPSVGEADCDGAAVQSCKNFFVNLFGFTDIWNFSDPNAGLCTICTALVDGQALCGCYYTEEACQDCCFDLDPFNCPTFSTNPQACCPVPILACCYEDGTLNVIFDPTGEGCCFTGGGG